MDWFGRVRCVKVGAARQGEFSYGEASYGEVYLMVMNRKVSYRNRTTLSAKECRSKKKSMFIV